MRIGIVNTDAGDVEVLVQAISHSREHQVIWIAQGGAHALELCPADTPDLILLDIAAGTGGVELTRRIMTSTPCAILLVTGSVHDEAARVFEALGHGAVDAVDRPASGSAEHAARLLARIATIARLVGEAPPSKTSISTDRGMPALDRLTLVAIGASTGGPAAVAEVLRGLPKDFPAAIVVVQHLDRKFASGMAEWLSLQSALPVRVADEDTRPTCGTVLLAGTSDHLILKSACSLGYTTEPRHYAYRPSVDVFLHSVSRLWRGDAVGVLLTGMGTDGALGLKALRERGDHTIAQDQKSCVVYGMPKAAAALNAAVDILPVSRIAPRLVEVVSRLSKRARALCANGRTTVAD
jgi:two-component system, chemotaxis family, response regulator WspF